MADLAVKADNIHATAILLGDRGILISGPSGSGKTTLALALVDHFGQSGLFARLVGDDQLFATARFGRLVCRAPQTIAGLAEVPGLGPKSLLFEPGAVIDLAIRLVAAADMARFQEEQNETVAGCVVPRIDLAERNIAAALPAVTARLKLAPFG